MNYVLGNFHACLLHRKVEYADEFFRKSETGPLALSHF